MQSCVSVIFEGSALFLKAFGKFKRYCGIFPYFVLVSKNVIKYISINLAIIHKCNLGLFTKHKILQSYDDSEIYMSTPSVAAILNTVKNFIRLY